MNLSQETSQLFVPNGTSIEEALARTTHLGIGAHPDDLEFMTWRPILDCFEEQRLWFSGVVVSDGRSSPRAGQYAEYSDQAMVEVRLKEQRHAATTGEYSVVVSLMHSETGEVMAGTLRPLIEDLKAVLKATQPEVVVTHNLADSHPHHLVVATATVWALRELAYLPRQFYGGEIWRSLDWLITSDKMTFDVSHHQNLTSSLMGVYDSQITGGKRYDLATAGRKKANATYFDPLCTDTATALEYGMDLLPLLRHPELSPSAYVCKLVEAFKLEVVHRLDLLNERATE